jgi:hypothetical protein
MTCRAELLLFGCVVGFGCARAAAPASSAPAEGSPPVRAPGPGASGCVESRELKEYVSALEAERQRARAAALAAQGVTAREVPSEYSPPAEGQRVGDTYERAGRRFAVVAQLASAAAPPIALAAQGNTLRPIAERGRAHPVPLLVCGTNSCPSATPPALPPVRAVGVELAAGQELGPSLALSYDYWWVQVSYDRRRNCSPEPTTSVRAPTAPAAQ